MKASFNTFNTYLKYTPPENKGSSDSSIKIQDGRHYYAN